MTAKNAIATRLQLCTFRLGELYLGLDVQEVQEVLHQPEITVVPHADEAVRGLINLRGQIATTVDMRTRFGMPPLEDDIRPIHVVVRPDGEWISLIVDRIADVIDVDQLAYEPPPETLDSRYKDLIIGTYKLTGQLLLVVDIRAAVTLGGPQVEPIS